MLLPVAWTLFALTTVAAFIMVAAYWLDLGARDDLSRRARFAWILGILAFFVTIPVYAFTSGAAWPPLLRVAAFVPLVALVLFFGFLFGVFT